MTKLLYVVGSPRNHDSYSTQIAEAYLEAYRTAYPHHEIDTLDLWAETLPAFDGTKAAAKLSYVTGLELAGESKTAWDEVLTVIKRFTSADRYLFSVPMWNHSVPYRLKQYIDIIMQPGLTFGFDPAKGYFGLLTNKKAMVIYTSGLYMPGREPAFGVDFQSPYFEYVLDTVGVTDRATLRFQPTQMTADPKGGLDAAIIEARQLINQQEIAQ